MAYWYDGAALAATGSPVIALFWCLIKFTTTTTTTTSLPILMLLYLMLHTVLAYLMLFAAMTNAVCLNNVFFFSLICANAFYLHVCLCLFHFFFNWHHAQCF